MAEITSLSSPEVLHIQGDNRRIYFGANQTWYKDRFQRLAGCGPTTCSNILWYLSNTQKGMKNLAPYDGKQQKGFLSLMEEVWQYVTPGQMGVNNTDIFSDGAVRYAQKQGFLLHTQVLPVPLRLSKRPSVEKMAQFVTQALQKDLPVAFLNLSNGQVKNLDSWHWVTLVAFDRANCIATMYDQGLKQGIDLKLWLETTIAGGGMVVLAPQEGGMDA
ncbi:hypothetical protein LJB83_01185 [Clostridia bacterium OttesenSCG-928-F22]|nr:hypothetical protein [Clostridia bacterium OttesenSCG-928-F22]